MKKNVLIVILFLLHMNGFAQSYNNSWIPFSSSQPYSLQQYFKITVVQEGIYRINSNILLNAGIPLKTTSSPNATVDYKNLQLFRNGIEQPIYVDTTIAVNGIFMNYLEFYGTGNDGFLDKKLYADLNSTTDTSLQVNPYYSLFNDTATYYLTWNGSTNNKRFIVEKDTTFNIYTPAPYFFREVIDQYTGSYYEGNASDPDYVEAEGYFGSEILLGQSKTINIKTPNAFSGGPSVTSEITLAGQSNYGNLNPDHHLRIEYPGSQLDSIFEGYKMLRLNISYPASLLSSPTPYTFSSLNDWNDIQNPGRIALSYIHTRYPHTSSLTGEDPNGSKMIIPDHATLGKQLLRLTNVTVPSGNKIILYDLDNFRLITMTQNGTTFQALIPNAGKEKKCYLRLDLSFNIVSSIKPVSTNPVSYGRFTNFEHVNAVSEFVIITHSSLMSEAINYKNYRNTKFKTLLVDVEELYHQFSFGVLKHPVSIKNFCDFISHTWTPAPIHIFLLGKGMSSYLSRSNPAVYKANLVPTYGYPASDNMLTSGLGTSLYAPSIPIGRLAAQSNKDIRIYLDKIKAYEKQVPSAWMKNVLHFGGGSDLSQQTTFEQYLNTFKNIIEAPYFGGKVHSFMKRSSSVIQINQSDYLHSLIDTGVSIITFFGHANGNGFDQNIDLPSAYNNKERYPLIIANSCFAGNIHFPGRVISEEFVLIEEKGAIGFIASISEGYAFELFQYSTELYREIANKKYGKSIGECMKATIEAIQDSGFQILKSTCLEMTLHGDPSVVINSPAQPDLSINNADVFYSPKIVTAQQDSFKVHIILKNTGKLDSNPFDVEIVRTFPDGSKETYIRTIQMFKSEDTISFTMPVGLINGVGINTFSVRLDILDFIRPELSELNNFTTSQLIIQSDEILPVYPYKYAIFPDDKVTLKASTSNPFAAPNNYIFEIDTSDAFSNSSPKYIRYKTPAVSGGVVTWSPNITLQDSMVYYWRVSPDSTTGPYKWRESSFIYIKGKTGWSQAHHFQFKNDTYKEIIYDKPLRTFDFVINIGALTVDQVPSSPVIKLNNTIVEYNPCRSPSIFIAVLDSLTLKPWGTRHVSSNQNPDHNFGNYNDNDKGNICGRDRSQYYFGFMANDPQQLKNMRGMLNQIPAGHYIIALSSGASAFASWDDSTYMAFEALGSTQVRSLTNQNSYIFFAKKGVKSTAKEVVGDSLKNINMNAELKGKWNLGTITSELIGPATNWSSMHWRSIPKESQSKDLVSLNIIGIRSNGTDSLIANGILPSTHDSVISWINAKRFPFLKFVSYMRDDSLRSPSNLKKWQVYYDPVPEAALNPSKLYSLNSSSIEEGDSLRLKILVENISQMDMDSMLMYVVVYDNNRVQHVIPLKRRKPLYAAGKPSDKDTISISIPTLGFTGQNSLWIEANPFNDQPEQHHFNNIGQVYFTVRKEKINPLMDVTFDGVHILDGDIVSSKPLIVAQLRDENKFLRLDTSSLFKLYLKYPNALDETLIPFDNVKATFVPAASSSNNKCRVEFNPEKLEDGKYELRIQSKDKSGNLSGYQDYKISFEVVNKSTISEVMNYPNPFSTSTQFVFTITGSELPTYFKIQIMTVSGKVVREIMLDELGPIHIGRNITDYAWDGKDEFGDRLANGLYLYRVVTQLNGNAIEKRESGADKYFKSGMGKMYLMR